MNAVVSEVMRSIPSVSEFLKTPSCQAVCHEFGEGLTKVIVREVLQGARASLLEGRINHVPDIEVLVETVRTRLLRLAKPSGRRAIGSNWPTSSVSLWRGCV